MFIKVSQGRSSFQELKTSLLFKKESLYNDEYAKKVLNTTRILWTSSSTVQCTLMF